MSNFESVGFRRLYDSVQCSIDGATEMMQLFEMRDFLAHVYFGPDPLYGIDLTPRDNFVADGGELQINIIRQFKRASDANYPRSFFTEITCWRRDTGSRPADLGFDLNGEEDFRNAADMVAGAIGLRFHSQLVAKIVCENIVSAKGSFDQSGRPNFELKRGFKFNLVEKVSIDEADFHVRFNDEVTTIQSSPAKHNLLALTWLLRAWNETDLVYKFLSLFIPIEVILQGKKAVSPPVDDRAEKLYEMINLHADNDKSSLTKYLKELHNNKKPPSLASRFEVMAEEANFADWETDVEAFKRFNYLRNGLVHRGESSTLFQATVEIINQDKTIIVSLQDMAERYLNWALYRDDKVHKVGSGAVGWHKDRIVNQTENESKLIVLPSIPEQKVIPPGMSGKKRLKKRF